MDLSRSPLRWATVQRNGRKATDSAHRKQEITGQLSLYLAMAILIGLKATLLSSVQLSTRNLRREGQCLAT